MNEEVQFIKEVTEESMQKTALHLEDSLAHVRAGRANIKILDPIRVPYYGNNVPLNNVANVNTPDSRTIAIQPWEKNMIKEIEKAIIDSPLGITPENNGEIIRICFPPLTEERRKNLTKEVRGMGEDAKISIRNARREAIDKYKKLIKEGLPEDSEKDAEDDTQKLHDEYIKKIDAVVAAKEKEIMTV